jgi:D-alanyl-lipoteichoic acid acyltransferase DltB (MBOAT superfamily)
MLFNSPEFIFIFLPLALALFIAAGRGGVRVQSYVLTALSLGFYAFWKTEYVGILLTNILVMFSLGRLLASAQNPGARRTLLIVGVVFCLLILGYYKYFSFVVYNLGFLVELPRVEAKVVPIGLSFYTFTSIAFLVDVYRRTIDRISPGEYGATITYFPHLVAGPILYHHDTIPQLRGAAHRLTRNGVFLFLVFFSFGLFKKIVLADGIARYSDPIFDAVASGAVPDTGQAWRAALCYTFQLYFDFSGYSDMAVGIANLFGIKIPVNFFSPYKARNISDFWRRWHISLGYFLRTYLYFPLGGSRAGLQRTLINMLVVMILCGVWHGAGWTFIVWGALHGVALCVHRLWSTYGPLGRESGGRIASALGVLLTFVFTIVCWVIFRSDSMEVARIVITSMFTVVSTKIPFVYNAHSEQAIAALLLIVWALPNVYQAMGKFTPGIQLYRFAPAGFSLEGRWQYGLLGILAGLSFVFAFSMLLINGQSAYLYFEF